MIKNRVEEPSRLTKPGPPVCCEGCETPAYMQPGSGFAETPVYVEKDLPGKPFEAAVPPVVKSVFHAGKSGTTFMQSNLVAAMATVLILSAIGLLAFKNDPFKNKMQHTLTITKGREPDVLLPDGTKVQLKAGSRLAYSREFGNTGREVVLEGEGFFDVAADEQRPFIVHTRAFDLAAADAAFSLSADKGTSATRVRLQRGQATIQLKDDKKQKKILWPNESISVSNTNEAQMGTGILNAR